MGTILLDTDDENRRLAWASGSIDKSTAVQADDREDKNAIRKKNATRKTEAIALQNIAHSPDSHASRSLNGRTSIGAPSFFSAEDLAAIQGHVDNATSEWTGAEDRIENAVSNLAARPSSENGELDLAAEKALSESIRSDTAAAEAHLNNVDTAFAALGEVADQALLKESDKSSDFPFLAWEAVKLCVAKEKAVSDQLRNHVKEVEKHQKDIDLLLDLSAELMAHKDPKEMPDTAKNLLAELKNRGIDLWKSEDMTVNQEKLSQLKSLISSQVDKSRSNLQIIFTTKIQVLTQQIGAILESVKDIIRNNSRLVSAANRLPGH